jgi:hypothetical protein
MDSTIPPFYVQTDLPRKKRPLEYCRYGLWHSDGRGKRVKKPHYHFIWPKDGKNGSKWGRTKDILTGKGPDIHVSISADKMDYMYNRPRKSTWAGWEDLDDRFYDNSLDSLPWTRKNREYAGKSYDFYTRKYCRPTPFTWTDVQWKDKPDRWGLPAAVRDVDGEWWRRGTHSDAIDWLGGPPSSFFLDHGSPLW